MNQNRRRRITRARRGQNMARLNPMARVLGAQAVPAGIFAGPNARTARVTGSRRARTTLGGGTPAPRRGALINPARGRRARGGSGKPNTGSGGSRQGGVTGARGGNRPGLFRRAIRRIGGVAQGVANRLRG